VHPSAAMLVGPARSIPCRPASGPPADDHMGVGGAPHAPAGADRGAGSRPEPLRRTVGRRRGRPIPWGAVEALAATGPPLRLERGGESREPDAGQGRRSPPCQDEVGWGERLRQLECQARRDVRMLTRAAGSVPSAHLPLEVRHWDFALRNGSLPVVGAQDPLGNGSADPEKQEAPRLGSWGGGPPGPYLGRGWRAARSRATTVSAASSAAPPAVGGSAWLL